MMGWKLAQTALCVSLIAITSACGGGGGGSAAPGGSVAPSPPPLPPPPPSNALPEIDISTPTGRQADERQILILDASATIDADGDTLTFQWTQRSGPTAEIVSAGDPITDVILPEVSSDAELILELTVSDGKEAVTETLVLTALNIDMQPRYEDAHLLPMVHTGSETAAIEMVRRVHRASFQGDREPADISGLRRTNDGVEFFLQQGAGDDFRPAITTPSRFRDLTGRFAIFSENINPMTSTFEIAIASETDDLIQIFQRDDEQKGAHPNLGMLGDIEVEAPCGLAYGLGFVSLDDPYLSSALIAGKANGGGIELFVRVPGNSGEIDPGDYNRRATITNNGSFCTLATIWFGPGMTNSFFDFLVGVDTDTSRIRVFAASTPSHQQTFMPMSEGTSTNIRRGPSGALTIVDSTISERGVNMQGPLDIHVLLAGPEHDSEHAVEVYRLHTLPGAQWPTQSINFEIAATLQWGKGRPKKIIQHDINGDGEKDIVILLESSPYLVVFTRDVDPTQNTPPLRYNEAQFIEVGFGFDDLTQNDSDAIPSRGLMLTKRNTGELLPIRTRTFTW